MSRLTALVFPVSGETRTGFLRCETRGWIWARLLRASHQRAWLLSYLKSSAYLMLQSTPYNHYFNLHCSNWKGCAVFLQERRFYACWGHCRSRGAKPVVLLLLTDRGWTLRDHTAQTMTTATRVEPYQILQMEITSHGKWNLTSPNSANESTCARAPPCLLCMQAGVCSCPFTGQPGKVEASHCSFRAWSFVPRQGHATFLPGSSLWKQWPDGCASPPRGCCQGTASKVRDPWSSRCCARCSTGQRCIGLFC